MHRKKWFMIGLVMGLSFVFALSAFAGDLQITVNEAEHTLKIFNSLSVGLYINDLKSGNSYLRVNAPVAAGSQLVVKYQGPRPGPVDYARCMVQGQGTGYQRNTDGFYHLTVDLQ